MVNWEKRNEEREERKNFIKNLKVGDRVYYEVPRNNTWGVYVWEYPRLLFLREVVKITPTGKIRLSEGELVGQDGTIKGHYFRKIHPLTEEIEKRAKEAIEKTKKFKLLEDKLEKISKCGGRLPNGNEISLEQIERILEIIKEEEKEKD